MHEVLGHPFHHDDCDLKHDPHACWATHFIQRLQAGETVQCRPHGHSMQGRIESGQLCSIAPLAPEEPAVGDAVLCTVDEQQCLHLVKEIQNGRYLIGDNLGRLNGWIPREDIYGRLINLEA